MIIISYLHQKKQGLKSPLLVDYLNFSTNHVIARIVERQSMNRNG